MITSLKRFYNSFTTQGNSHFPTYYSPLLKFVSWFVPSLVCSLDKGGGEVSKETMVLRRWESITG